MFIDFTRIELIAGNGGPGAVSFRREKYISKGGPDGGDGGRGGHIIFFVDPHLNTLQDIRYRRVYKAEKGATGRSAMKTGRNGEDIRIAVPQGTMIKNDLTDEVLADLIQAGQEFTACKGGKGGRGNVHFKSSTRQTPRYAQPGLAGEKGIFEIELKVLADVGLVGLPNAGKSTLVSRLSAARPKIAEYPFTTLQPHIGIVKYGDFGSFVIADIPGLIEGASKGKGLGHQFLKHIERTRVLIFMIESQEENPVQVFNTLQNELNQFNRDLALKKYFIVRTKIDMFPDGQGLSQWDDFPEKYCDISSVSGAGINTLIKSITEILNGE